MSVDTKAILVHFEGYTSSSDEYVDKNDVETRIREVGSFSNAEGWAKYSLQHQENLKEIKEKQGPDSKKAAPVMLQSEEKFREKLQEKDLRVVIIDGDGNCLFRAIAH